MLKRITMNGKRAKAIRRHTTSRQHYLAAKDSFKHFVWAHAQQPKPLPERKRKPKQAIKATWPHSPDQKRQSRPVIVMRPVLRRLEETHDNPRTQRHIRVTCNWPKRYLDALASA